MPSQSRLSCVRWQVIILYDFSTCAVSVRMRCVDQKSFFSFFERVLCEASGPHRTKNEPGTCAENGSAVIRRQEAKNLLSTARSCARRQNAAHKRSQKATKTRRKEQTITISCLAHYPIGFGFLDPKQESQGKQIGIHYNVECRALPPASSPWRPVMGHQHRQIISDVKPKK